jgi:hypothetical protein
MLDLYRDQPEAMNQQLGFLIVRASEARQERNIPPVDPSDKPN